MIHVTLTSKSCHDSFMCVTWQVTVLGFIEWMSHVTHMNEQDIDESNMNESCMGESGGGAGFHGVDDSCHTYEKGRY